uniref:C2H2-type domain-containing protein n=1 Tax=Caenorhabditis tropicalis TaxID=1561998 RepID=A0A1I7U8P1_9PELO
MPLTVPLIGRNLCFWCVEAFRNCPIHENSNVFWNDVSVKTYSDDSDEFRIVDEKELINVEKNAFYTENGRFFLPPNGSSLPVLSTFHFEKIPEKDSFKEEMKEEGKKKEEEVNEMVKRIKESFESRISEESKEKKKPNEFKIPKLPKEKQKGKKTHGYSKPHKNVSVFIRFLKKFYTFEAIKSVAREYKKGKKCDESLKVFLCDICEFSFTLRHNLQSHLVQFHGKTENVSDEKVALLKQTFPRKEK